MAINISKLTVSEFCEVQGLEVISRTAINRMHKNTEPKSYDEWYELLSQDFKLSESKNFTPTETAEDEEAEDEAAESK